MTSLKSKRFLAFLLSCLFLITTFAGTAMVSAETTITDNGDGTYTLSTGETWAIVSTSADDISYDLNGDGTADTLKVFTTMNAAMLALQNVAKPHIGINGALTKDASNTGWVKMVDTLYVRGITDDACLTEGYYRPVFATPVNIDNLKLYDTGNDAGQTIQFASDVTLGSGVTSDQDFVNLLMMTSPKEAMVKEAKIVINSPSLKVGSVYLVDRHGDWLRPDLTYGDANDPSLIDITINGLSVVNHWKGCIWLNNWNSSAITFNSNLVLTIDRISYSWGNNPKRYVRGDNATWNGTVTVIANNNMETSVYETFMPQVDYYVDAAEGVYVYVTEETKKSAVPTFEITVPTGTIPVINGAKSATLTDGKWYYTPAADTDTTAMETLTVTYEAAPTTVEVNGNNWAVVSATPGVTEMEIDGETVTINACSSLSAAMTAVKDLTNPHVGVVGILSSDNSKTNSVTSSSLMTILGLTSDAQLTVDGMYNVNFKSDTYLDDLVIYCQNTYLDCLHFAGGNVTLGDGVKSQQTGWRDHLLVSFIYDNSKTKHVIDYSSPMHLKNFSLFASESGWVNGKTYGSAETPALIEWNIHRGSTVDHGGNWNGGINMGSRENKTITVIGNAIVTIDSFTFDGSHGVKEINGGGKGATDSAITYNGTVSIIQNNGTNIAVAAGFQDQVDYLVKVAAGGSVAVTEATKEATLPTFEITAPAGKTPFVNGVQATLTGGKWYYTPAADADTTTMETLNVTFEDFDVTMIKGASIRFKTPAGIRFGANLNGLDALTEAGYTYKVGMLIAVTNKLSDIDFTAEAMADADVKYLDIETKVWNITPADGKAVDYQTMNVAYNIPSEQYGTQLSGRAYVDVTKGDVTTRYYAAYSETDHVRSIRKVAEEAIDSGKYAEGSTQYTDLQAYL